MKCPLCTAEVPAEADLEAHIREELDYARWRCRYCVVSFFSYAQALTHFDPAVRTHPGKAPSIAENVQIDLEKRVQELMGQDEKLPAESLIKPDPYALVRPPLVLSTPLEEPAEPPATDPQEALLREKMDLEEEEEEEEPEMVSLGAMGSVKSRPDEMEEEEEEEELVTPSPNSSRASLVEEAEGATSPNAELGKGAAANQPEVADETAAGKTEEADVKPRLRRGETCQLCRVVVVNKDRQARARRTHVVSAHLSSIVFKCLLCDEGFRNLFQSDPAKRRHFRKRHPDQPVQLKDFRSELAEEISRLIRSAFPAKEDSMQEISLSVQKGSDNEDTIGDQDASKIIKAEENASDGSNVLTEENKPERILCQLCDKPVLNKSVPRRFHITAHMDGGSFACAVCGWSFAVLAPRATGVRSHFRVHHPDEELRVVDRRPPHEARRHLHALAFPTDDHKTPPQANDEDPRQPFPFSGSPSRPESSPHPAPRALIGSKVDAVNELSAGTKEEASMKSGGEAAKAHRRADEQQCRLCDGKVKLGNRVRHVAFRHNDAALFSCDRCDFDTKDNQASRMRCHTTAAHAGLEERFTDHRGRLRDSLDRLFQKCFG